ncbi:MAG TPA: hypothetical protein VFJ65_06525 [Solirubrobacterales bacterium]|nr:hypothetical protein [Solirubrobacterales bacterium]
MRIATPLAVLALAAGLLTGCGGGDSSGGASTGSNSSGVHTSTAQDTSTTPAGVSVRTCPLNIAGTQRLRASGVSCGEAQRVALVWWGSAGCTAEPGASHSACSVRGYRCIGTATDRGLAVSCARPGRAIAFTVRRG